jgi:hypothetical protein
MTTTPHVTDLCNRPLSPIIAGKGDWQMAVRPHEGQPAANSFRRRFNRGIGFWLGGVLLGAGGCLFGASMPCEHPVGVALSVLWWGIYFGCLGMNLGALVGLWAEQAPAAPAQGSGGAGEPPSGANSPDLPAGHGGPLNGANQTSRTLLSKWRDEL